MGMELEKKLIEERKLRKNLKQGLPTSDYKKKEQEYIHRINDLEMRLEESEIIREEQQAEFDARLEDTLNAKIAEALEVKKEQPAEMEKMQAKITKLKKDKTTMFKFNQL